MTDGVLVETRDATTIITINRPQVRNAVDRPTAAALVAAFDDFDHDDTQAVAILTGADGTFCAGADLGAIASEQGNRVSANIDDDGPMGPTRMVLSKPVIAAVEGHAVAGGLELALWCDLRVAATDSIFGVFCRRWGVPLVDGGTVRLPRLIGQSRALDLVLTGRPVEAAEAFSIGLVNRLTDSGEALSVALELADQLARFPQNCLRSDRASVLDQWGRDERDALSNEVRGGLDVLASGETVAGAKRFAAGAGRGGSFSEFEK